MKNEKVEQFRSVAEELSSIYEKKNADYGDSFSKTYQELGIISAITRISDKTNRLKNLATKGTTANYENINDTLKDMASYCIMTLMELENI